MFDCHWTYDVDEAELEKMINQLVDGRINKKLKDIKVKIPQEQINNAVVKFFTEKKWFLTENGKKLDTYDLIRKFAMNTIGVSENGELNSEMLNIVQQEVGKILAEQIYNNAKNNISVDTDCKCGGNCACTGHTDEEPVSDAEDDGLAEYEELATIKSIVNVFIRYYEKDKNKYELNHLLRNISYIENNIDKLNLIKFRLKWLDEFLNKINSFEIFNENREIIENYFSKRNYEKNYQIEFILKCISYLCFKENYPEYNIDSIIKENFKRFKFRDI